MSTTSDPADTAATSTLVRVEKGHADAEELAAVTAVLLARAAAGAAHRRSHTATGPRRSTARWRRLERQSGFRAPHSWQG
ncbi:acyl-CoA carboxylase subunit epsilon [Streptomyces sp. NPDC018031]|uniref:acyl-CoA carboxylase subunit epsilon n=1 Tax=Streptomyces sp. NPDC018031 TaxID=3365033 RepID=UPI0037B81413